MVRGNLLLKIGDDLPRIGRHVLRYRHGASLSAREGGDLVTRIDAHPSICQKVALKHRKRPTDDDAGPEAAASQPWNGGLGLADYAVRGMTGNGARSKTLERELT
jgi:hypothetical protein